MKTSIYPGTRRRIDLTGRRFSRWTVLKFSHLDDHSDPIWLCKCDCGAKVGVRSGFLLQGRSRSCGCFRSISNKTRPKGKGPPNKLAPGEADKLRNWRRYQKRAKDKGIPIDLTFDDFIRLLSGPCFYCNSPPTVTHKRDDLNGAFPCNGIDRMVNTLGYTKDNCVTACNICNKAKNALTISQFSAWLHRIHAHHHSWAPPPSPPSPPASPGMLF